MVRHSRPSVRIRRGGASAQDASFLPAEPQQSAHEFRQARSQGVPIVNTEQRRGLSAFGHPVLLYEPVRKGFEKVEASNDRSASKRLKILASRRGKLLIARSL